MTAPGDITRRQALLKLAAAAAVGLSPVAPGSLVMAHAQEKTTSRMPAVFLPHGGGPWPFIDAGVFGDREMWTKMSAYMKALSMTPPSTPRAVLVISAHWEAAVPTVMSAASPPMLYDYSGFPPEAYEVTWPAPGLPELAAEVRDLLDGAGLASAADAQRGFDHGVFVPLKLAYPAADVPCLQLSLVRGLDPRRHVEIGLALAPLRDRGVFIVGSGMSYHNMGAFRQLMRGGPGAARFREDSKKFDDWLAQTIDLDPSRRETRLIEWASAPAARACHPREEHLLPLMVVAGAAFEDAGTSPYRDVVMGAHVSAVHFG